MLLSLGRVETAMKSLRREEIPLGPGDDLEPGALVNGCYRIEQCIEQSKARCLYTVTRAYREEKDRFSRLSAGKQAVYRQQCEIDLPACLFKMEVRQGWLDPVLVQRLLTLCDPRIASIYDVFSLEPYTHLVSEHMDGVRLDQMEGLLTTQQIRIAGTDLCETVELLHRHGIYGMDLRFSNLRIVDGRLRLISLSTSRTVDGLSQGDAVNVQQEDLLRLLDALEKLAGEYVAVGRNDGLSDLFFAIEDLITQNQLSTRHIRETLRNR
jgi:tRNA A-37 threonylcarbamoyl transferase component Bud32